VDVSESQRCITQYGDLLKSFQSFLDSVDRTVSTVDMAVATRAMSTLLADQSWLQSMLDGYRNGSLTKRQLSDGFLREKNNWLLLHVDSAMSGIESSVLPDVTSIINTIETRTISFYSQLILYLYKLQTFMSVDDTAIYSFAKKLLLWSSPIPMLQDKTVSYGDLIFP